MTEELKIVAWSYEFHDFAEVWGRGIVLNRPDGGANPPTKHYGSDVRDVQALCRHDEAMAEIERLRAENERLQRLFTHAGEQLEECRQRLASCALDIGLNRDTIAAKAQNVFAETLSVDGDADIVGTGPASYRIADLLTNAVAEARDKALDEAASTIEAISHEGLHASMWRNHFARAAAAIRALKVKP